MKVFTMISGGLLVATVLLCFPPSSEAAPGCDAQDEEQWEQLKAEIPRADGNTILGIISALTKLKDKCDPRTRFSASVVKQLIKANFREHELREKYKHITDYGSISQRPRIKR